MRYPTGTVRGILAAGVLAVVVATPLGAQSESQTPPILVESLNGRDSFELYCSPCHGKTGRGEGPVAPALRAKPTDSHSPVAALRRSVPHRRRPCDCDRRGTPDGRARDERHAGVGPSLSSLRVGRPRSCANREHRRLHREPAAEAWRFDGSRSATVQDVLCLVPRRERPWRRPRGRAVAKDAARPDEVSTARNGGIFPSERLRQIIDGRGVAAHGDREMPVWGDAFQSTRGGVTPEAAKARIDAIVRYLDGIQEKVAQ